MAKNKYRNPERDAYYENLENELKEQVNLERNEVVLKGGGFGAEKTEPPANPEPDEGNWKKRYGDLQRHLESLKREWSEKESGYTAEIARLKESTKAPELPANLTDEDIKKWEEKFPDVAAIIDYKARKRAKEIASGLEEKVAVFEEDKKMLDHQRAYLRLLSIHEDYEDIRKSDEFSDWLAEQDEDIQKAITSPKDYSEASVRKAARVVDFFKLETGWGEGKTKSRPEKDTSAARTVPSRGSNPEEFDDQPKFTESQIQKMSPKEFEAKKEQIFRAMQKGAPYFVYDVTGAAR